LILREVCTAAGAMAAVQPALSNPVSPASSSVGSSGAKIDRLGAVMASARKRPSRMSGRAGTVRL